MQQDLVFELQRFADRLKAISEGIQGSGRVELDDLHLEILAALRAAHNEPRKPWRRKA